MRPVVPLAIAAVGFAACLVLALIHALSITAPGCGAASGCQEAARSPWSRLPLTGTPIAFIGTAYFASLAAAFVAGWQPGAGWKWVVRLAALSSIGLLVVSALNAIWCPYCVVAHLCSLAIWLWVELHRFGSGSANSRRPWIPGVVAIATLGLLSIAELSVRAESKGRARADLAASVKSAAASSPSSQGFTGRYRQGPDHAALRIVVFTDYQCPDCRSVEAQLESVLSLRTDVSLSIKHFPFCSDCNRHVTQTLHPNSCWAARAAETAGELGGSGAFWKMHRWLFARAGRFTDVELRKQARELGLEPEAFENELRSNRSLERVRSDIEEGMQLGLAQTPMIFINGVEIKGWQSPEGVVRAVEQIAAARPASATAAADRPPTSAEKAVADWQSSPVITFAPAEDARVDGAIGAEVSIVVFGDYQVPLTAEADAAIRAVLQRNSDVRYEFRHFPVNSQCNPASPRVANPMACRMARAAQGAAMVGGRELFWKVHTWILAHQRDFSDAGLRRVAAENSIDPELILKAAITPDAGRAVESDCVEGGKAGVTAVPAVFINGRLAPRWRLEGTDLLEAIVTEARREAEGRPVKGR